MNTLTIESLRETITANIVGKAVGIYSICSAHPFVLETSIKHAKNNNSQLLIESTCNQVNQYGGYTNTTPFQFVERIHKLAREHQFSANQIVLGGDHLGPYTWRGERADSAMDKAEALVNAYVQAGYQKIHIDTSMACADDPAGALNLETVIKRAVRLCESAEHAYCETYKKESNLVYVFGSEVPAPGGQQDNQASVEVTDPEEARRTFEMTFAMLESKGLSSVCERVIGFVVQPGVEFGDDIVFKYERDRAKPLSKLISKANPFVFEAHSTDYQPKGKLKEMVEDHFAILKVGPALTFAMREAIFALAYIEEEIIPKDDPNRSEIFNLIEAAMKMNPIYWQTYYSGSQQELAIAKKFSYLDRIRYYWNDEIIQNSLTKLFRNLTTNRIPESLLRQFFSHEYRMNQEKIKIPTPRELIELKIMDVLEDYRKACSLCE